MTSLRFTQSAENDLLEAWLYVAENSPDAADRMLDQIETEARKLLEQPRLGRSREDLAPNLRSWPTHTPYILYYIHDTQGIIIVRALHHARDLAGIGTWPVQ